MTEDAPLPPLLGKPRHLAIAAGVLLAVTLIIFEDLLLFGGGRILGLYGTDMSFEFVGETQFAVRELASGHLPLWNPHVFAGAPCLGGFQQALLYPPSWLNLLLPLPQALNLGIALHVFLAGLFTYMWMARRGMHPAAAIVAGLIFMFGGGYFLHITAGHLPNLRTMVWAPLIFLAIDDLTTTRSLRGAWLGAGAVAMQVLAGHPQYVYYTALIAGAYALLSLAGAPSRKRAVLGLALMGAGGAGISAVQLFTGLAATRQSMRSNLGFPFASVFPLPPENLLTLVMPKAFGDVVHYWGRWFLWENCLYVGVAAMTLAVYGMLRGAKAHRHFATGFLVACILIALGRYTPIYRVLYHIVPGFSSFRGVSKFAFLAMLFLANLAAAGFDRLLLVPKASRLGAGLIASASALVLILGAAIWIGVQADNQGVLRLLLEPAPRWASPEEYYTSYRNLPVHDIARFRGQAMSTEMFRCGIIGLGLAGLWLASRWRKSLIFAIAGFVGVETMLFAWQNRPTFEYSVITAQQIDLKNSLGRLPLTRDARVISGDPALLLGAGGSDAWGNDPMILRRYAEFIAADLGVDPFHLAAGAYPFRGVWARNWGMVRVQAAAGIKNGVPGWTQFVTGPDTLRQLPRAMLIENAEVIPDRQKLLAATTDPKFDCRAKVLLEEPVSPMPVTPGTTATPPGTVVDVHDRSTDQIEVTATVTRPCILLFSDTYSDGWHASPLAGTQQKKYQVVPADYALRAIPLSPGEHHLLLEFRPTAFVVGTWVTLASLIAWIVAGVMLWVRPRATGKTAAP